MRYLTTMILTVLVTAGARGQTTLIAWEITGQTAFGTQGLAASAVATGITNSTGLTRGSGVTTNGTAAADAWGGNGWNYASAAEALAANVFVTFGLTVSTSFSTSLTSIALNYRRSTAGPLNGRWDYQLNSGTWTTIGDFTSQFPSTSSSGSSITPIDLSGKTDLQSLPAGTVLNFRIIPYGASASNGNWYVNDGSVAGYDLTIAGSLVDLSLAVEMRRMTVTGGEGKVYIEFATATELDLAGFNLLRSFSRIGPFETISSYASNASLRAAGTAENGRSYSFIDNKVSIGGTYFYKIEAVSKSGSMEQIGDILAVTVAIPKEFALYQNYPNPFNPVTTMKYDLKERSYVRIQIFDLLGRMVKSLGFQRGAGTFETPIEMGGMPSGVYYYRMTVVGKSGSSYIAMKKMSLIK